MYHAPIHYYVFFDSHERAPLDVTSTTGSSLNFDLYSTHPSNMGGALSPAYKQHPRPLCSAIQVMQLTMGPLGYWQSWNNGCDTTDLEFGHVSSLKEIF